MTCTLPLSPDRVAITSRAAVTCLGRGRDAHLAALSEGRPGLTRCDFPNTDVPCFIGRVRGIEDDAFPTLLAEYDNRANRLALAALEAEGFAHYVRKACDRWGKGRVGCVFGTSTSGIECLERAYLERTEPRRIAATYSMRHHNDYHAVASFLLEYLGLEGPGYTVSTACSSSAKAIVDGVQLVRAGLCDAVVAGGADSLCLTSLYGFDALELVSRRPCRPYDAARDGLSIGEGAGFILIERDSQGPRLSGYGETSDAVNMSTPPADGAGAVAAMRIALDRAELEAGEVDFVKLHGTATPANDAAEGAAVAAVLGRSVPAASLKGMIGHTLGAAGAVEAVMCLDAMDGGILPASAGLETPDPAIDINLIRHCVAAEPRHILSNAFGFGGNNCCLVLSRA